MPIIRTFFEMKNRIQANLEENEESLSPYDKIYSKQLKAYLIESNKIINDINCPAGYGRWERLDTSNWYVNQGGNYPGYLFLDTSRRRVWILYSLLSAEEFDAITEKWLTANIGLDKCWLSRKHLLRWEHIANWHQKGLGLRFSDGLSPEEEAGNFSLKAWHGAVERIQGLDELLRLAKDKFAIYSSRWQKISEGSVKISAEWYSNGKVTINKALDVDDVFLTISDMANHYEDALVEATDLRDKKMGAFELNFTQNIDLDAFSSTVTAGKGIMNLWLIETESKPLFRRFKGIDLHTWDRILMDVGPDYAYLTIPGQGCVNAAPRIATIQGEDNSGNTSIFYDGDEVFV